MKRLMLVGLAALSLKAAPCSAQKAQPPLPPAAAHSKKQDQGPQFTHAEMIQFLHTVQTEAANWKAAINSVQPSALHIYGEAATIIEQQKSLSLDYVNSIGKLDLPGIEINRAVDLGDEFLAFNDLAEFGETVNQLSDTLSSYASGQIDAAKLVQIKKEVNAAKATLYGEILSRILSMALSEKSSEQDKPGTTATSPSSSISVVSVPRDISGLELGMSKLELGMSKDQVAAMLAATYRLEPAGSDDWWNVSSKPPYSVATPYKPIASLGFESGKLVFITKRLFEAGRELSAPAFSRGLQAIVAQFLAEQGSLGPATCLIWTDSSDFPESEDKRLVIQCGMKLLVTEWTRANGNEATGGEFEHVTIDESVGTLPKPLRPKK